MSRLKPPYGTTAELTNAVVQERDFAYDTTLDRFVMGDGVEAAGKPLAFKSETDALDARIDDLEAGGSAFEDVASAATTDIGAASSDKVRITGTTTITSFGTAVAGARRKIRFAGALTLTHNATSLILPGNANIVTKADDTCEAISLGSGNWVVTDFQYEDMPLRRVSSSQVSLYSNGGTVEALRIYDASGSFRFGTPTGINTAFPEFEFYADLGQPKFYTRSIFLADPGDTPEVALQNVGGTYASPTAIGFAYHLGGFIYCLHYDGTATTPQGPLNAPTDGDVSGQYPYLGRAGEIAFPTWVIPSQTNRKGGILFETCPDSTIVSVQRAYYTPDGGHVSLYRAGYEDTGVSYPWDLSTLEHWERSAPGAHNYSNTPAYGNYTAVVTDRANGSVLAMRKYNALTTGFDFAYTNSGDVLTLDRIVSGSRIRSISIVNADGIIDFGHAADLGNRAVRITPVASQVNYWELKGATTGNQVELIARGDDTNVAMTLTSKGTGSITFLPGGVNGLTVGYVASAVNYISVDPNSTGNSPLLSAVGSDTNVSLRIRPKGAGELQLGSGLRTNYGASDVNYVDADGATTTNAPTLSAKGSDTNINLLVESKGTGSVRVRPGGVLTLLAAYVASGVNYVQIESNTTGNPSRVRAQGSDTNVDLWLSGQGTGILRFGTHTALGGESVTGYITIKDDGGTTRKVAVVS